MMTAEEVVELLVERGVEWEVSNSGRIRTKEGRCPICAAGYIVTGINLGYESFSIARDRLAMPYMDGEVLASSADNTFHHSTEEAKGRCRMLRNRLLGRTES